MVAAGELTGQNPKDNTWRVCRSSRWPTLVGRGDGGLSQARIRGETECYDLLHGMLGPGIRICFLLPDGTLSFRNPKSKEQHLNPTP